jgi:hypothetical protein
VRGFGCWPRCGPKFWSRAATWVAAPPYGYRLVDAGAHPNAAHARWGRRLQRLEPDPVTARHVRWMFDQRLAGHSASRIAYDLNARGVLCPSSADPGRNRHRSGAGWTLRTVATILANPRYTGRQVWNRQRTDHDSAAGRKRAGQRWNDPRDWVISRGIAHPALVSKDDFIAAQAVTPPRHPPTASLDDMSWSVWWSVGCVGGGWTRIGCTADRVTVAGTAAPAPTLAHPVGPNRCTYARTAYSPESPTTLVIRS